MTIGNDVEAAGVKEEIPHDHLFKVTGLSSTNLEKLAQGTDISFFVNLHVLYVEEELDLT